MSDAFHKSSFFSNHATLSSMYDDDQTQCSSGPQPAWDTRGNEEFSERGPNFLNYVQ